MENPCILRTIPSFPVGCWNRWWKREFGLSGLTAPGIRQHSEHEAADRFCEQHGIYVIENLKNMEQIHYQRFTLYTMWLEDEVMTGLRCRVIAECLE